MHFDQIESCPFGNHIELSPIEYEVLELTEGQAPTMDGWRVEMTAKGYDLWTTDELRATEIEITGFAMGFPLAKVRGQDFWLDSVTAPDGDRYYYSTRGDFGEAVGETHDRAEQPTR